MPKWMKKLLVALTVIMGSYILSFIIIWGGVGLLGYASHQGFIEGIIYTLDQAVYTPVSTLLTFPILFAIVFMLLYYCWFSESAKRGKRMNVGSPTSGPKK